MAKYSFDKDKTYFALGASIAAGRSFWVNSAASNKILNFGGINSKVSKDGKVLTLRNNQDKG